jgi:hypothetical protein
MGGGIGRCDGGAGDPVRRVWLHLRDGRLAPAEIARVSFDSTNGRSCVLRMIDAEPVCEGGR